MTPAARVQAAIEVLDAILDGLPAEQALTGWARRSRFAGSKDRAAVRDHVFQALRCKRSYAALGGAGTGRGLMLGALRAAGEDADTIFTGARHAPAPLDAREQSAGAPPADEGARWDMPDWLIGPLRAALGAGAEEAALALRERAPVVLRVNVKMKSVSQAIELLREDGIEVEPAAIAPTALRVTEGARRVAQSEAYRSGAVELQDGSSQAAMEVLEIAPGARVLDYCAGGGGKTLALAARCEAQWLAHDAVPRRMAHLPARADRAGVNVTCLAPGDVAAAGPFDMVLCDAPCSGSGTWRRSPDAKWRLTPARLDELVALQARILDEAQALVAPGGQLAYATCSLLREENEAQSDALMARHPQWAERLRRRWPVARDGDGFYLSVYLRP